MKKLPLAITFVFITTYSWSQIAISHLLPHDGRQYSFGYGGMLKLAYPISEGDDITMEGGIVLNFQKGTGGADGIAICPLKLGYRYTFDGSGSGFYVEPQLGYNLYGVESYEDDYGNGYNNKFNGIIAGAGTGYIFQAGKHGYQYELGIYSESVFFRQTAVTSISLRFLCNFNFWNR